MADPLLKIPNYHTPACGDPPFIEGGVDNRYIGYFENMFGEQWIFIFDHDTGKAVVRGGDVEWDKEYEVVDGRVPGLVLGKDELVWLYACWLAVKPNGPGE